MALTKACKYIKRCYLVLQFYWMSCCLLELFLNAAHIHLFYLSLIYKDKTFRGGDGARSHLNISVGGNHQIGKFYRKNTQQNLRRNI